MRAVDAMGAAGDRRLGRSCLPRGIKGLGLVATPDGDDARTGLSGTKYDLEHGSRTAEVDAMRTTREAR